MEDKLAIINSGGGFKGCFGAGFLCGLVEKYDIREPRVFIGGSSGSLTGLGYIAGNMEFLEDAWTNTVAKRGITRSFISWGWKGSKSIKDVYRIFRYKKLRDCFPKENFRSFFESKEWKKYSSRDFVNMLRIWQFIDVGYLINEIFEKQKPSFDLDAVYDSSTNFLIPALNSETGKIGYFSSKNEYFIQNPNEIVRACHGSCKLPIASGFSPADIAKSFVPWSFSSVAKGLKAEVKVKNKYVCDSLLSASAWTHVERTVKEGAEKILVIDHDPYGDYSSPFDKKRMDRETFLFNLWFKRQSKIFQDNYQARLVRAKNYFDTEVSRLVRDWRIYTIKLPGGLIGTLDNDEDRLRNVFSIGKNTCLNDENLYRFLKWD